MDDDYDPRLAYDLNGDPLCRTCGQPGDVMVGVLDCLDCIEDMRVR